MANANYCRDSRKPFSRRSAGIFDFGVYREWSFQQVRFREWAGHKCLIQDIYIWVEKIFRQQIRCYSIIHHADLLYQCLPMKTIEQYKYTATVYTYPNGRMAVHGNNIRGLILEVDSIDEMRSELLRLVPILLRDNHGLNDEETANAILVLSLQDAPAEDTDRVSRPACSDQTPALCWEDSPRLSLLVYA